jgi:hypothetical protein
MTTAKDLKQGDGFRIEIYGEVVAVNHCTGGLVRVRLQLFDTGTLEFTDACDVIEFVCPRSRIFNVKAECLEDALA